MRVLLLISLFFILSVSQAQYSLLMTRPLKYNGGLAGNLGYSRISFNTGAIRNNEYGKGFKSSISYDMLSKRLGGGIGLFYSGGTTKWRLDGIYVSQYHFYDVGVVYSPKFIIHQKYALAPYVTMGYKYRHYSATYYLPMEKDAPTGNKAPIYARYYTDVGFLLNRNHWFLGYKTYGVNSQMLFKWRNISHIFQFGRFFTFSEDQKYGMGIALENNVSFKKIYSHHIFTDDKYEYSDYTISPLHLRIINPTLLSAYLKLSRVNIGFDWQGTNLEHDNFVHHSRFTYRVGYSYKNNWKFGYSINYRNKYHVFDHNTYQEIGFQYLFVKKNNPNKLFSVPLRN